MFEIKNAGDPRVTQGRSSQVIVDLLSSTAAINYEEGFLDRSGNFFPLGTNHIAVEGQGFVDLVAALQTHWTDGSALIESFLIAHHDFGG